MRDIKRLFEVAYLIIKDLVDSLFGKKDSKKENVKNDEK